MKKTTDKDNDDRTDQISKRKKNTCDVQEDTTLKVSPGPSHDLVKDEELAKARSKEGKRKVKKVGPGGILKPVCQTSSTGARYYTCPYELCEETVVSTEGMRSHIRRVHALYSYSCSYCHFTTKNFDSLKPHEKGCKGAYDSD